MIKAIPTRYAGCEFRSRLEARWAVAFDALGIPWQYEAQGFETSQRLTLGSASVRYLPDFWLPEHDVFVEVKGSLTAAECVRLLDAAASLSSADGGGCHDSGGHDLVVLGPVPACTTVVPTRLHLHKGCLIATPFALHSAADPCSGTHLACDLGADDIFEGCEAVGLPAGSWYHPRSSFSTNAEAVAAFLLGGTSVPRQAAAEWPLGYAAARSARFEFGQSGGRA